MTVEAPRLRFPSDIYDFLITPDLKIEPLTRLHRGEVQPYVRLTRKVVVGDEVGLKTVSESIHVFDDTLKELNDALFSGVSEVVPGSSLATAQANFKAVTTVFQIQIAQTFQKA